MHRISSSKHKLHDCTFCFRFSTTITQTCCSSVQDQCCCCYMCMSYLIQAHAFHPVYCICC